MKDSGVFRGGPADGVKFAHSGHVVGDLVPFSMLIQPMDRDKPAKWQKAIYEFKDESGDVYFTGRYEEEPAVVVAAGPDDLVC